MKGTQLDRYVLDEPIGSGGMAVVYLGHDTYLGREVAVKVMHPHLASREESRRRFSREAQAVARLRHPAIVEIFDFSGDDSEVAYIVTELVRGRTLRAFGDEVGFALPEIAALVGARLADALAHAHEQGVIHRDLKPENVMVREDGALKLMDFGIARMVGQDDRMTLTGALMGSPHHMAPEIIEGKEAEVASDLFSMGTILYWMVTGKMAFEGNNPTHSLRQILESDYVDPRTPCPTCPASLAEIIATCLRRDPKDRFPSAAALRDALLAFLAEAGIDKPQEERLAFFRDPAGHVASLRERIHATLLANAKDALALGRKPQALALLDRLLSMDPEGEEALALLTSLRRANRRGAWAKRAGALGALGLLAAGLFAIVDWGGEADAPPPVAMLPQEPAAPAPPPEAEPTPEAPTPPAPQREAPPARRPAAAAPKEDEPEEEAVAEVMEEEGAPQDGEGSREVHLRWVPQGAVLYLNGMKVDTLAPSWTGELPVGEHRVALHHSACCQPFEERLVVEPGEDAIRRSVVLQPKESGWFEVDCDVPDAEVWLDGSFRGTVAEIQRRGGVAVAFSKDDSGQQRYVKDVRFNLLPPQGADWPPLEGEVVVRAGQRTRSEPLDCAGASR